MNHRKSKNRFKILSIVVSFFYCILHVINTLRTAANGFGSPSVSTKPPKVPSIVMNSTGFRMIDLNECQNICDLLTAGAVLFESLDSELTGSFWIIKVSANKNNYHKDFVVATAADITTYPSCILANIRPFQKDISNGIQYSQRQRSHQK